MDKKLKAFNNILAQSKYSPFYRDRIPYNSLRSLDQLKAIPLTTKEDLKKQSPFDLISVPQEDLYQYHESSGTTGTPVSSWFTKKDFENNVFQFAKSGVSFNERDIVLVRFPYSMSTIAHLIHAAAQVKKSCVIPASARTTICPLSRVIELLKKLNVTILACISLQALMLGEAAKVLGLRPDRDFPHLRAICTAGELLTPGRRKLLEETWRVPVFDFYGMTEIGNVVIECKHHQLHLIEEDFFIELLDEDLKTEVKPGFIGNLVVTTLKKRASPMIRYVTGDRAVIQEKECSCGRKASLVIRGRKHDTIPVGDRVFDLWDLNDIVSRLPCQRFWVVGPYKEGLHFVVEQEADDDAIDAESIKKIENKYQVPLFIELVPKETICNRQTLLSVGLTSKPRYIYSAEEMAQKVYMNSF